MKFDDDDSRGAFASEAIAPNELLIEYIGEVIIFVCCLSQQLIFDWIFVVDSIIGCRHARAKIRQNGRKNKTQKLFDKIKNIVFSCRVTCSQLAMAWWSMQHSKATMVIRVRFQTKMFDVELNQFSDR